MATQSYEQLISGANKIRQNELPESNTAALVGEQLLQMVNKQQEESRERVKGITEYNVSVHHPTSGTDGTNRYTLETAIVQVPPELRNIGLKVPFINSAGKVETWEFQGVKLYRERVHGSLLIITHSTRILEALTVDAAHVMENGVIVKNGGAELVEKINEKGFSAI